MAGFKTHITVSSLLGVGYGGAAYFDVRRALADLRCWPAVCAASRACCPTSTAIRARPLHESMAFAAAVVPMMLLHRFQHWGLSHEMIILAGAAVYLLIRFGVSAPVETIHGPSRHVP